MSVRTERLNKEMKKSIAGIIRDRLDDPRIPAVVSVTSVEITPDLKFAKVFVSTIGKEERQEAVAALNSCAGYVRSELAVDFKHIRTVPKLTFCADNSIDYGAKIESILKDIGQGDAD